MWDLDETSIILTSLLNGMFAGKFNQDSNSLQEIGISMNEIIYTLINTHFFNRELEVSCKQTSKQTGKQTGKQTSKQTGKQTGKQTSKQTGKQTGKQTSKQTGKQTSKQTGKQQQFIVCVSRNVIRYTLKMCQSRTTELTLGMYYYLLNTNYEWEYSGSRLIGRLGSRHSVPFIRLSRLRGFHCIIYNYENTNTYGVQ